MINFVCYLILSSPCSSLKPKIKSYSNNKSERKNVKPEEKISEFNTYHTFVIQVKKRDKLKEYLNNNGVETAIHYPIPIPIPSSFICIL